MIQRGTSLNCLIDFIFSLYHSLVPRAFAWVRGSLYHVSQSPFFLILKQNVLSNEALIALFYLGDKTV